MSKRAAFVSIVSSLLEIDDRAVLLLGDISVWAFRHAAERHPKRVINIGVCEQAMVSFGAGLALAGFYPVIHTIDSFLVRRAYEQIRLDFGEQRLPGLFVTVGGSSDYAKLGPTHMAPEAPVLMRQIPNLRQYHPFTEQRVAESIEFAVKNRELAYVRIEESLKRTQFDPKTLFEGTYEHATAAP